jgi:diguanylate cyclase (GGDEF)-like protein
VGGRFVLVNAVAAANLQTPAEALVGASPADFLPAPEAAERRQWEAALIRSGEPICGEDSVASTSGERAWLATHKPAAILGGTFLVSTSVDITERKQIESNLAQCAYLDNLTGLPNRVLIEDRVEQALRRGDGGCFALAFLDLDNFKHINDYFSHAVGDGLLVKLAERVQAHLRDGDMLARISGDEFLLFIDPVESEEQIRSMIDGLVQALKQPFHIEAFEVFTSASFGVSIYPEHGTSYETLRRNADHAMYRAKTDLKGGATYFDAQMGEKLTARMELEQRLRLAIRDGKFCCAFQPKVDIHNQNVVGFETLVRWRDEAGDIQPPSSFIGLAIDLGLIDPITQFVLAESVRSIARLDEAFGADTTISINIAAKQASDLNFMRSLAEALKDSRYAERIMLELTEEAFVAKSQFQMQVLPMLRELGVRVSIDDFGTGYSSLSVLADITADEVKVDRSFITDIHQRPRSQSVLRTIESLCFALGMTVVAEGVETFEELAYLQTASRIRCAQGYYFSKPFFLDDLKDTRLFAADLRPTERPREPTPRRGSAFARGVTDARAGQG